MKKINNILLSAKSIPDKEILQQILKAGIRAVELYLTTEILNHIDKITNICKKLPLRYAVHAPNDGYDPVKLSKLVKNINAEVVVFHNMFWDDEWDKIARIFKDIKTKVCIENISTVHEPVKFERRYGWGRCLDIEHLQMECGGVYEEEFIAAIKCASHIHLTGYSFGSRLWHTHLHHSPQHSAHMLSLLKKAGYSGFVVSEAKASLQSYAEFKKLADFYNGWCFGKNVALG